MISHQQRPALFLDRDGVINKEINYLHRVKDFIFLPGVFDTCRMFLEAGFALIVVTNQSGIARGYYTEDDYHLLTRWMMQKFTEAGAPLTDVLHCPHLPNGIVPEYRIQCACRKPEPGMILEAGQRHDINLGQSIMVGDKLSDIMAGGRAGVGHLVLVHSGYEISLNDATHAHHVAENLGDTETFRNWFL
ncbi:MAG: D-glycero-beta-D-manno-heptose 1,7-bisphosphate 7-phosphatase [Magnetococcales bacterium]|nr:D-glycero-beta-D-manno-heptose 1,7-bisphosphate 7-phosphatase [Magnetococcales bacterium]